MFSAFCNYSACIKNVILRLCKHTLINRFIPLHFKIHNYFVCISIKIKALQANFRCYQDRPAYLYGGGTASGNPILSFFYSTFCSRIAHRLCILVRPQAARRPDSIAQITRHTGLTPVFPIQPFNGIAADIALQWAVYGAVLIPLLFLRHDLVRLMERCSANTNF